MSKHVLGLGADNGSRR